MVKRTRNEQDIEQVAGILAGYGELLGEIDMDRARQVNATSGWGFDVRYDDNDYVNQSDFTRVEALRLADADLDRALALAKEWARL